MNLRFISLLPLLMLLMGSSLPRGKGKITSKAGRSETQKQSGCSHGVIRASDAMTYRKGDKVLLFSRGKSSSTGKDLLLEFHLKSQKFRKRLAIPRGKNIALGFESDDSLGVSILSFDESDHCWIGKASGLGLRLKGGYRAKEILPRGDYALVAGEKGRFVADLSQNFFVIPDFRSYQRRRGLSFKPNSLPLYLSTQSKNLVVLEERDGARVLVKYMNSSLDKKLGEITLNDSHHIVQHSGDFFIGLYSSNEVMRLRSFGKWVSGERPTQISVPRGYKIKDASFFFNSNRSYAVIYKKNPLRTKRWKKAFVYDLVANRIEATLPIPKGHFAKLHIFDDANQVVYLMLSRFGSQELSILRSYNFSSKEWKAHHINGS